MAKALKEINPSKIYLLGDKTEISSKVISEIKKVTGLTLSNIERIILSEEIK